MGGEDSMTRLVAERAGSRASKANGMKTITLEMPDGATSLDWCSEDDFPRQLRLAAAIFWYDRRLISQGKGAEIAGLTRAAFLLALSDAKVNAF